MTVWRVQVSDPLHRRHDVFIDAEPASSTTALVDELEAAGFHARPLGVDGTSITSADTIADLGLSHGSVITCGRLEADPPAPGPGRYAVVVSGPDAGTHAAIPRNGVLTVGRSEHADLTIDDPLLSAQHCQIEDRGGLLVVTDLGSTNGTELEGDPVTEPADLSSTSYLHVGSSVVGFVDIAPDDLAVVGELDGADRTFPRQYRSAQTPLPAKVDAPRHDKPSSASSGAMWWRALLPVVTGFGMAAITGRWIFLLVMLVSPLVVGFDALRRKRRRAREAEQADQEYRQQLDDFRRRARTLRRQERTRARDTAQAGGVSLLVSSAWHRRLWERIVSDPDFLSTPVGLGRLPSAIQADDPDGELDDHTWGMPLETSLLNTGSLGIVGPHQRARAVARGLVMNVAANHSPATVKVWILTRDENGDDWGFARWLPHAYVGEQAGLIASTDADRASLIKSLKQTIETRADLAAGERSTMPLPIHLVIVDETDLMAPGELADLLDRGPRHGVVGITIDPRLAPEGIGATLTLADTADGAVFQSRHQPRIGGLIVSEVGHVAAEAAARRMAGLRPTATDEAEVGGICHLVEIDGLAGLTAERLVDRWQRSSPNLVATVGMASETPMHIDLVNDGPHGLVGGTSGSGKTEFLKTLFLSLCLNNHPDDLSIVIVDFKGGVDHDGVRPLPHVVDVATNLDIEQFRRTIALLRAEQMRRQELLGRAGANNVASYRLARASRPELPPLPRLLVVVDEFGELLASDHGREQLKELESITRIGRALGLHLLLVTQNFESNLPAQIDANAGLRVCLRVQKPGHSKAVLDSGVAATIPDKRIGRAYARFHGRELVEFQTARVAGRRRDLAAQSSGAVDVRAVPFSALGSPPPERRSEDVPVEETDMYALVETIRGAAAATGWSRNAVPWPSSLPTEVSLSALAARHQGDGVPIGLADVPSEQRRVTAVVTERDEQIAVVGATGTPLPEVLATYATSLALLHSPDDLHLYGIDMLGRGLAPLADLPHCGGLAVRNEQLGLRILRWLLQVAAERKVELASTGSSNIWEHASVTGELPPLLVLVVNGTDRLLSTSEGAANHLAGPLTTLMSEGVGVRIQVVLGGLPKIVSHRLGMNIRRRLVLHLNDPAELPVTGAPKSARSELLVPRRVVDVPSGRIVQLAQLARGDESDGQVIRSLADDLPRPAHRPPHRFADVSWPLPWDQAQPRDNPPAALLTPLPVAIDTRSGDWLWIDAADDGPLFAVAGPPKSGRSSALVALARMAVEQGWSVVNAVTSRRSPLATTTEPSLARRCQPDQIGPLVEGLAGQVLVVIDDAHRLEDKAGIEAALAMKDRVLVVLAGPPDFLDSRTGVMRGIPAATSGVVLAPTGSLDGGAIGLRRLPQELTSDPRPGRGLCAIAGEATEVQFPYVRLDS